MRSDEKAEFHEAFLKAEGTLNHIVKLDGIVFQCSFLSARPQVSDRWDLSLCRLLLAAADLHQSLEGGEWQQVEEDVYGGDLGGEALIRQ